MTSSGSGGASRLSRCGRSLVMCSASVFVVWLFCSGSPSLPSFTSSSSSNSNRQYSGGVLSGFGSSSRGMNSLKSFYSDCDVPLTGSKNYFFSFASGTYLVALDRILREATATKAFDETFRYTPEDIPKSYIQDHFDIFNTSRGFGYWVWKPYLLMQLLTQKMEYGDVIMYADAGCEFTGNPAYYIDLTRQHGFLGFKLPLSPKHVVQRWTKGDIFDAVGLDMETFGIERQHVGGIWLLQKRPSTMAFVADWLRLAEQHQLVSDSPSISPNHPEFQENRHDQAIYSLLLYKHGLQMILEDRTFPREISPVIHAARRRD